jgi:transmembrane sensor
MIGKAQEAEEAAAGWLLRQEETGWSEADREQLEAWLNADPEHRVAYWRLEYGWRRADRIAELAEPAIGLPADDSVPG